MNNYSVYLSHNQSDTNEIYKVLNKHLNIDLTKVNPEYLMGMDIEGKYTMIFNKSRLSFTFNNKVTPFDVCTFDNLIDEVLRDNIRFSGYVIHKDFDFLRDKIIRN